MSIPHPWMLISDFNEILLPSEVKGVSFPFLELPILLEYLTGVSSWILGCLGVNLHGADWFKATRKW